LKHALDLLEPGYDEAEKELDRYIRAGGFVP
jgi:hypothetical protein